MTKRTFIARAIYLAAGGILLAATAAAMTMTAAAQTGAGSAQDLCVIGSVSVPQACPSTINPALASKEGFMPIHLDNQKKNSPVAAYWRAQTSTATVGWANRQNAAP